MWAPEEDAALLALVKGRKGRVPWGDVRMQNLNNDLLFKYDNKQLSNRLAELRAKGARPPRKYKAFSVEEVEALRNAVAEHGADGAAGIPWQRISHEAFDGTRTGASLRSKWRLELMWTQEMDETLRGAALEGALVDWEDVQRRHFPDHTPVEVSARWKRLTTPGPGHTLARNREKKKTKKKAPVALLQVPKKKARYAHEEKRQILLDFGFKYLEDMLKLRATGAPSRVLEELRPALDKLALRKKEAEGEDFPDYGAMSNEVVGSLFEVEATVLFEHIFLHLIAHFHPAS